MTQKKHVVLASYLEQHVLYSEPKKGVEISGLGVSKVPIVQYDKGLEMQLGQFGEIEAVANVTVVNGGFFLRKDFAVGTQPGTELLITDIDNDTLILLQDGELNKNWRIAPINRETFIEITRKKALDASIDIEMFGEMARASYQYYYDDFELGANDVVEIVKVHIAQASTDKDIFHNEKRHSIKCAGALLSFICGTKGSKAKKKDFFQRLTTAVEFLGEGLDELGVDFDIVVIHENSASEIYRVKSESSENTKENKTE